MQSTIDGGAFMIDDTGPTANRIIVFASDEGLTALSRSTMVFMDGTFSMAPRPFNQLYVLRVIVDNVAMAVVYALLPNKTTETYERVLRAVVSRMTVLGLPINVRFVMTDFETAAINAASRVFGANCQSSACFFHLTQVSRATS